MFKTGSFISSGCKTKLSAFALALTVFALSCAAGTAWAARDDDAGIVLEKFGIRGIVDGSSYGHNPNGFMANVNSKIYIVDMKNNRLASIENPDAVFKNLDKENSRKKGLFITQFLIYNDSYDKDRQYGEWRGRHHLLPMYILVDYDKSGNMVPDERFFSGEGASPGHYHGDIREQKNIDLAVLFVSEVLPFVQNEGFIGEMTP